MQETVTTAIPKMVTAHQLINQVMQSEEEEDKNRMDLDEQKSPLPKKSCLNDVVILDCQSPQEFQECHIRGALNVTFPAIMMRRIAAGKIDLFEQSKELKAKVSNARVTFVVYDSFVVNIDSYIDDEEGRDHVEMRTSSKKVQEADVFENVGDDSCSDPNASNYDGNTKIDSVHNPPSDKAPYNPSNTSPRCSQPFLHSSSFATTELSDLVYLVAKKLAQSGCTVVTLKGGLPIFRRLYPEWTESSTDMQSTSSNQTTSLPSVQGSLSNFYSPGEVPLLGLGSLACLKIEDDFDACDSSLGLDPDDAFPVEITKNLYLGNASTSADLSLLEKHNILHILNVTPDLPNYFEDSLRYLKIPISDHWSQSMIHHFPAAIQFIDEGLSKGEGVLIHCLAGISRSVTITMAYLMFKMKLSLNEAYDAVRSKKSNISPNFHFMSQLLDFEGKLQHSQSLSPPVYGSSPDSGIEFDRWNSA